MRSGRWTDDVQPPVLELFQDWTAGSKIGPHGADAERCSGSTRERNLAAKWTEALPPILKAAWRGDLNEIVKRRVVRVLVPFRRPEFFYMDGRPVGVLQEAFQELEKVLNATHKTTAANRIIVALVPTPADNC